MHLARVKVWYEWNGKRGEVEHIGGTQFSGTRKNGNTFTDEDAPKKSVTDALIKALSMIGFAGDIFMGRYDDSKYVASLKDEERGKAEAPAAPDESLARFIAACEKHIETATDYEQLGLWWNSDEQKTARRNFQLSTDDVALLKQKVLDRRAVLKPKEAA